MGRASCCSACCRPATAEGRTLCAPRCRRGRLALTKQPLCHRSGPPPAAAPPPPPAPPPPSLPPAAPRACRRQHRVPTTARARHGRRPRARQRRSAHDCSSTLRLGAGRRRHPHLVRVSTARCARRQHRRETQRRAWEMPSRRTYHKVDRKDSCMQKCCSASRSAQQKGCMNKVVFSEKNIDLDFARNYHSEGVTSKWRRKPRETCTVHTA